MYVRWKVRKPSRYIKGKGHFLNHRYGGPGTLYAYLCESKRVEGKVRSRTVTYLASVPEDLAQAPMTVEGYRGSRSDFWGVANRKLDALTLAPTLREKLAAELAARVWPISAEDETFLAEARTRYGAA